jgi:hypothetical protein
MMSESLMMCGYLVMNNNLNSKGVYMNYEGLVHHKIKTINRHLEEYGHRRSLVRRTRMLKFIMSLHGKDY